MVMAALVGGALAAGSLLGGKKGGGGNDALRQAIAEFSNVRIPSPEEMKVKLQELVQQGVISPEQAEAVLVNGSNFENVSTDPRLRAAQLGALNQLQDISEGGGMTDIDRARTRDIQDTFETENRGAQGAIMEDAKRRGTYGSGVELANRALAGQAAAGRASRAGTDVAAEAQKRAMEAILQTGNLSGNIRSQDYGEAAKKAAAMDEIAKFNAANKQGVINTNVAARNNAQAANLGEKQRVADTNTALTNQNRIRNADLIQKNFENKMQIAAGKSGQYANLAASEDEKRKRDEAYRAALLGAGGTILAGAK